MFLLLPTCDTHAAVAAICARLLERYWPGHPELHVLHHAVRPEISTARLHDCGPQERVSWLQAVAGFLRTRAEELFVLLLDDYAMCGPARVDRIVAAAELMRREKEIGLFPLCWYPAARRTPHPDCPGVDRLHGSPVLLQAAIWRRSWFLELADAIGGPASPWGFEARATQLARSHPRAICAAKILEPVWFGGSLIDGMDKADWPLPYHNLMRRGEPAIEHAGFLRSEGFAFPARGLGDTIAALAEASGAARVARAFERAAGRPCGCEKRRRKLNQWMPYPPEGR